MARYSKGSQKKVEKVMHEFKEGKLKSSSGDKVTNPRQAIAIGLSEAREAGEKVPAKKAANRKSAAAKKSGAARKTTTKKTAAKKSTARKSTAKKTAAR